MISKEEMFEPLLEACPSFQSIWDEFLDEWSDEPELPQYLALTALARHLINRLENGDTGDFETIFAVVERWHIEGDHYVREAASVGLLEDLQNGNLYNYARPEFFQPFLLPESKRWWKKIRDFWQSGKPLNDD